MYSFTLSIHHTPINFVLSKSEFEIGHKDSFPYNFQTILVFNLSNKMLV